MKINDLNLCDGVFLSLPVDGLTFLKPSLGTTPTLSLPVHGVTNLVLTITVSLDRPDEIYTTDDVRDSLTAELLSVRVVDTRQSLYVTVHVPENSICLNPG